MRRVLECTSTQSNGEIGHDLRPSLAYGGLMHVTDPGVTVIFWLYLLDPRALETHRRRMHTRVTHYPTARNSLGPDVHAGVYRSTTATGKNRSMLRGTTWRAYLPAEDTGTQPFFRGNTSR